MNDLLLAAAGAGAALPAAQYIEDVFSTTLFTGTGAALTVDTKVPITGTNVNGALVWTKSRSAATNHQLTDTLRGSSNYLSTNTTNGNTNDLSMVNSFSGSTFQVGSGFTSGATYAAWTFARAGKFVDIVTWTGDGSVSHSIKHGLGCVPGMIMVKRTDTTGSWAIWHNQAYIQSGGGTLSMTSSAATSPAEFGSVDANQFTVKSTSYVNGAGGTFVAYVFAGNPSDATGLNLMRCDYYTGNGTATGPLVNLGWEPQFVMVKAINGVGDWYMYDAMRGLCFEASSSSLSPDTTASESSVSGVIRPTSNGFQYLNSSAGYNASGILYAYIAIRRGQMRVPTDATKVFQPVVRTGNSGTASVSCGFPADAAIIKARSATTGFYWFDRGRGPLYDLTSSSTLAAASLASSVTSFAQTDGVSLSSATQVNSSSYSNINYMLRRARGFFDIVYWVGDGVDHGNGPDGSCNHGLGVTPDLFIWKNLSQTSNWWVQGWTGVIDVVYMQSSGAQVSTNGTVNGFMGWASNGLGPGLSGTSVDTNVSGNLFVGYLFANCPGVLSTGTYTGDGSMMKLINCGFTNGARFVMVKRLDSTGNWLVSDTARGITSTADPVAFLNTATAENATDDWLIADPRGFYVQPDSAAVANANVNGAIYLYLAIA